MQNSYKNILFLILALCEILSFNFYLLLNNTNVLRNPKYLRPRQFQFWWQTEYKEEVFVKAEDLLKIVLPTLK